MRGRKFLTPEDIEANRLKDNAINKAYQDKHPKRIKAGGIYRTALQRGDLVKPTICEECKADPTEKYWKAKIHGHHDDYSKPLEIRWLCAGCHKRWHRNNKPIEG